MTSEAPQDVAALPQTEAGKRAADWMRSFALGNPAVDRAVRLIADAEREAAAGLLDQNDRLRSAVKFLGDWIAGPLADWVERTPGAETIPPPPDTALLGQRGSGAKEAARNE